MWSSVILCFGGLGLFAYMKIANVYSDLMVGIGCMRRSLLRSGWIKASVL